MNVRTGFTKIVWLLKAVTLKGHGIATVAFSNLSANHVFLLNHQTKQMRKCYGLPVTDVKAGTIRCVWNRLTFQKSGFAVYACRQLLYNKAETKS